MNSQERVIQIESKLIINDESLLQDCRYYLGKIIDILNNKNINTQSDKIIGLGAHIYAMVERINKKEAVFEIDEEMQSQIDEKYKEIAKEVIAPIKEKRTILNESSEVFLVAVHIQNLLEEGDI